MTDNTRRDFLKAVAALGDDNATLHPGHSQKLISRTVQPRHEGA